MTRSDNTPTKTKGFRQPNRKFSHPKPEEPREGFWTKTNAVSTIIGVVVAIVIALVTWQLMSSDKKTVQKESSPATYSPATTTSSLLHNPATLQKKTVSADIIHGQQKLDDLRAEQTARIIKKLRAFKTSLTKYYDLTNSTQRNQRDTKNMVTLHNSIDKMLTPEFYYLLELAGEDDITVSLAWAPLDRNYSDSSTIDAIQRAINTYKYHLDSISNGHQP